MQWWTLVDTFVDLLALEAFTRGEDGEPPGYTLVDRLSKRIDLAHHTGKVFGKLKVADIHVWSHNAEDGWFALMNDRHVFLTPFYDCTLT